MSPELSPEQSQAQLSEYERLANKTEGLADVLEPKPIDDEVSEGVDKAFEKIAPFETPFTKAELDKAVKIPVDNKATQASREAETGAALEKAFKEYENDKRVAEALKKAQNEAGKTPEDLRN